MLDGELAILSGEALSFDALQNRLHPAESRVRKLAAETPAMFILFDCLATALDGNLLQSAVDAPPHRLGTLLQRSSATSRFCA